MIERSVVENEMTAIRIEVIELEQVESLKALAEQTFKETFGHVNTTEQLRAFFDEAYSLERLSQELLSSESEHYFISVDDQLAGYMKVNWGEAQTEHELGNAFEIQRIYILQAFQGYGLGKKLFELALEKAKTEGFDWVWLGVWEGNVKAQSFYKKYGFTKFSEHRFQVSEDKVDIDWLLRKPLS